MIKAVIFDFDGVILESAGIKTAAFGKLFENEYPDQVEDIVDYHKKNMGISRYTKFKHIYKNILKKPLSKSDEEMLGKKFSTIVFDEILRAPFVPGARKFIEKRSKSFDLFIASGTPIVELAQIIKKRKLGEYFVAVHGTPENKDKIISDIMKKYNYLRDEVVFVGDAESDFIAAEKSRINFVLRLTDENKNIAKRCSWKVQDLSGLAQLIRKMG